MQRVLQLLRDVPVALEALPSRARHRGVRRRETPIAQVSGGSQLAFAGLGLAGSPKPAHDFFFGKVGPSLWQAKNCTAP